MIRAALLASLLLAAPAFAGQAVTLKAQTTADGPVTLGDIFDNAGRASNVVIAPAPVTGGSMVIDAATVQRAAMNNGLSWANENGVRRVIVRAGLPSAAEATVSARPAAKGVEVLTWTRNLDAGEVIAAEDLTWSTLPAQPAGSPRDADALIGKVAKKPIRSGSAALTRDVSAPQVIKKDDMVEVAYEDGGILLKLMAKAMGPASVGEPVALTNLQSKKVFQGIAAGPGRAVVGPEALALRAEAAANPSQFARR